jgi:hypothetical protein
VRRRGVIRPADPDEALAGTVMGMVLCEPGEVERQEGMPFPQPRPIDPSSYVAEDLYGMINEIASSSWDSIVAQNSQPVRMQRAMPAPAATRATRGSIRPRTRVAFCLQAEHRQAGEMPGNAASSSSRLRKRRWWTFATSSFVGCALFAVTWMSLLVSGSSPNQSSGTEVPLPAAPSIEGPLPDDAEPVTWDSIAVTACCVDDPDDTPTDFRSDD